MTNKKEEHKVKEKKWEIKDLVKEVRIASYRTRELQSELLSAKLPKDSNCKKTKSSVINIENGRALADNGLYNAVLGSFLFIDVEHEIDIVKKAKELADALIAEKTKFKIKDILSHHHLFYLYEHIEKHTKRLKKSYIKELFQNFSWEISIQMYDKIESKNPEKNFVMNDSAKFVFYLVYHYLLGTYEYDNNNPTYRKEDTIEENFSGVAKALGHPDWDEMPEGQIKTKALKNINILIGLYNHITDNPDVMEYLEAGNKLYQSHKKELLELLENNEQTKELSDVIIAVHKETQDCEDNTKIYSFLNNVEYILLLTFCYYQGQLFPGPSVLENFKEYTLAIEEFEESANEEGMSENDKEDFIYTIKRIKRHYEELEQYYNELPNLSLKDINLLIYKTRYLSNIVKHLDLEIAHQIFIQKELSSSNPTPQQ